MRPGLLDLALLCLDALGTDWRDMDTAVVCMAGQPQAWCAGHAAAAEGINGPRLALGDSSWCRVCLVPLHLLPVCYLDSQNLRAPELSARSDSRARELSM